MNRLVSLLVMAMMASVAPAVGRQDRPKPTKPRRFKLGRATFYGVDGCKCWLRHYNVFLYNPPPRDSRSPPLAYPKRKPQGTSTKAAAVTATLTQMSAPVRVCKMSAQNPRWGVHCPLFSSLPLASTVADFLHPQGMTSPPSRTSLETTRARAASARRCDANLQGFMMATASGLTATTSAMTHSRQSS
jgi:hypothetical protein